jgi:hypothetical protein
MPSVRLSESLKALLFADEQRGRGSDAVTSTPLGDNATAPKAQSDPGEVELAGAWACVELCCTQRIREPRPFVGRFDVPEVDSASA